MAWRRPRRSSCDSVSPSSASPSLANVTLLVSPPYQLDTFQAVMLSPSSSRHSSSGALSIHWLCSGCGESMPSIASACELARVNAVISHLFISAALLRYAHFAEHARFHVIEQVAVIGPAPQRIGAHQVAEHLAGLDA